MVHQIIMNKKLMMIGLIININWGYRLLSSYSENLATILVIIFWNLQDL